MRHRPLFAALLLAAAAALISPTPAQAASGGYISGTYVSLAGIRSYHGYVPSSYRPGTPMPMLVALHGCTEAGVGFAVLTGLSTLAEERGFIVVYPQQNPLANPTLCWNWFLESNQHRGLGEPSLIAGITNRVRSQYTVDSRRIYVAGASAGGVMSVIMGVTYPDLFAAVATGAGCEYDCDVTRLSSPDSQGRDAYREMGRRARAVPVIIFQGTADIVVPPATADRIVGQWAQTNDLALDGGVDDNDIDSTPEAVIPGAVPGGRSYTRSIYRTTSGTVLMEKYLIEGAGHQWPGGCSCSIYGDPSGPDASALLWDFFVAHPRA